MGKGVGGEVEREAAVGDFGVVGEADKLRVISTQINPNPATKALQPMIVERFSRRSVTRRVTPIVLFFLGVTISPFCLVAQQATVIRGATVYSGAQDGSSSGVSSTVRIEGARIVALGEHAEALAQPSDRVIDANGLLLMPGFIDTHSHHDVGLNEQRSADAAVSQGITTIVVGADGGSALPVGRYLRSVDRDPAAVNVATYVGHGTIRREVLGADYKRHATTSEIDRMTELVDAAMRDGALGVSTGLEYDPGIYATTDEVVTVAKAAARHGGRYMSHMRSEDRDLLEAIEELIEIGRRAQIPVHISHLKLAMKSLHGRSSEVIERLSKARAEGIEISADVYPYDFWQSTMTVLFPDRDFTNRETADFALRELAPPEGFFLSRWDPDPKLVGKSLSEIAAARKESPVDVYLDLLQEAEQWRKRTGQGGEMILARSMTKADIETLYQWEHTNVSSDGALEDRHPRGAGSFPKFLAEMVRESQVLTWGEASYKTSALAAANVGLRRSDGGLRRGVIEPGAFADLVLVDRGRVRDRATSEDPGKLAEGIVRVWVNGEAVWDRGRATGARPGQALRRTGVMDPHDPRVISQIDALFSEREMGSVHQPGCSLGIFQDGELQLARGYGMASLEDRVALDRTSIFRLASVSKQFTAATIAALAVRGALELDEPVSSYLPSLSAWGEEVTVRQLVHHSSGVRDYLTLMALAGKRDDDYYTDAEVMAMLERQRELNFEPGSDFLYSNAGYFLLGQIAKAVTGRPLREVADELLFEPLGMSSTHFHDDHAHVVPHRANGYGKAAGNRWRQSMTTLDMVGDGGVFSSVEDLGKWTSELTQPNVLSAEFHRLMQSRQTLLGEKGSEGPHRYGFGLFHQDHRGLKRLGHGGAFVGYRTDLTTWPEQGLATVVLCNRSDARPDQLGTAVGELLLAQLLDEATAPAAREPEQLAADSPTSNSTPNSTPNSTSEDGSAAARFTGAWYSPELNVTYSIGYSPEAGGVLDLSVPPGLEVSLRPGGDGAWTDGFFSLRAVGEGERPSELRLDAGRVTNLLLERR